MERGDLWVVDLEPVSGREQRGTRPVLIVSKRRFNLLGTPLICPVTTGGGSARAAGWAVPLTGSGTDIQGVVLVNQVRTLDILARNGRRRERVPDFIMDEVLARLAALVA